MKKYDLIVLGGGRASGLAIAAAQEGKSVALIEKDRLGGTCPNTGCVPSKLLIGYAEAARRVKEADRHFITAKIEKIDRERIFQEVNEWVRGVDPRYEGRLDGVDLYRGHGRFVANKVIEVNGEELEGETIVVATGTRPRTAPYPGAWTNENIFPLEGKVPDSLTVVGGGFIACELANFFSAVGVETRLLVRGDDLLPIEDHEIGAVFKEEFVKNVPTDFGVSVTGMAEVEEGYEVTIAAADGSTSTHRSERVLFAIGRTPNTDDLGLDKTDLEMDRRGYFVVNDKLQTNVPGVYAAGDVAGRYQLQHVASYDVHYLRQRLLKGLDEEIDYGMVPHGVFTDPEVAAVGQTEAQLKEAGTPYVSVFRDWKSSARAMASRLDYPRVKLLVSPADYSILGCHLVGPDSSTVLHEVLPFLRLKNDVREMAEMMHVHPALPELLLDAAVQAVKEVREAQAS
ncbi:dihydrolipoyl dehydrogenase family protein [Roseibacillus ishigakijimensis]|uniref:Dihydrolipoyl dehydrogenase n=1 Tax=Roseibacillus ishigakijimensis TaxID=454146 RepID=A0A934RSU3_9BACT|nr:dihydrolipoyl dehydrogenase [Roseibacillus ishigakijimensis]MBK1834414.1 dihydrolipoyl dehydrogenase [Roseibacillus ishigakijimensis]